MACLRRQRLLLIVLTAFLAILSVRVHAQTFATIDVPRAVTTVCLGINSSGEITGYYTDQKGVIHGFYGENGIFHSVHIPYSYSTYVYGISEDGVLTGTSGYGGRQSGYFGFRIFPGRKLLPLNYSNDYFTVEGLSISPINGVVAGLAIDYSDVQYGFYNDSGSTIVTVVYPGILPTALTGGNDFNQFVGTYIDTANVMHGLTYDSTTQIFTQLDYPGAVSTSPNRISNSGLIVGTYQSADQVHHGFTYVNSAFTDIDYPGAIDTQVYAISEIGVIVGSYTDTQGKVHGFMEKP
jgi:uncharacterized membrane protein